MIEKFVIGQWYRIKTWDELIKEFPLTHNRIDVPGLYYYTKEIEGFLNDNSRILQAQNVTEYIIPSTLNWAVSPQMCEPIGKEILEGIMREL